MLSVFAGSADGPITWQVLKLVCRLCGSADVVEHGQLLSTLCVHMAFAVIATHYPCQAPYYSWNSTSCLVRFGLMHRDNSPVGGLKQLRLRQDPCTFHRQLQAVQTPNMRSTERPRSVNRRRAIVLAESANHVSLTNEGSFCKRTMSIAHLCSRLDIFSRIRSPKSEIYCFKFCMRLHTTFAPVCFE